jgi:hypothetical protein
MYVSFYIMCIVRCPMKRRSENPFNYDMNDLGRRASVLEKFFTDGHFFLDLDHFCLALQRELHEITAVCSTYFYFSCSDVVNSTLTQTHQHLSSVHGMNESSSTRAPA